MGANDTNALWLDKVRTVTALIHQREEATRGYWRWPAYPRGWGLDSPEVTYHWTAKQTASARILSTAKTEKTQAHALVPPG